MSSGVDFFFDSSEPYWTIIDEEYKYVQINYC
jgi:hypothetical protein